MIIWSNLIAPNLCHNYRMFVQIPDASPLPEGFKNLLDINADLFEAIREGAAAARALWYTARPIKSLSFL